MKVYAMKQQTSVSELVEHYFESVTRSPKRKNAIDIVNELGMPAIDTSADLKNAFYEDQAAKYGL